jgi:hypothetical protein
MFFYRYNRPGHADHDMRCATLNNLAGQIGAHAPEGDYKYYVDITTEVEAADALARPAQVMATLRAERNERLTASDWTQLPDAPTANAAAWKTYRQALRDLPQRTTYPNAPQWPTAP